MSNEKYQYGSEEHKRKWGGHLYDRDDFAYWMTPQQYNKAKDYDLSCPDNAEGDAAYFDWFDDFVKREKVKKEPWKRFIAGNKSLSSYWTKSSYDDFDDSDGFWSKGKGSQPYASYSGSLDGTRLGLASALQAAQSVVDVISDDEELSVSLIAGAKPTQYSQLSYTDFERSLIMISPDPYLKEKEIGLDLTSALALHEGSHGKWTNKAIRDIDAEVTKDPKINATIGHFLSNILEDIRIEKNLVREYPGFREYMTILHDWIWSNKTEENAPSTLNTIPERLNTALISVKFPEKEFGDGGKEFTEEIEWWKNWSKRYRAEKNLEELMREGHARILRNDPLPKEDDPIKMPGDIHSAEFMNGITDKEANEILSLVKQEVETLIGKGGYHGGSARNELAIIRRPLENDATRSKVIRNDPLISRMKDALVFRQAKPQRESNLLEDGDLDEDQLHRVASKDFRVFKSVSVTEDIPEVSVTLLIDASGSMFGYGNNTPMSAAHRCATIMVEALKRIRGCTTDVIGFTTSYTMGGVDLTRVWEPGDNLSRLGILQGGLDSGGTPTGLAIMHIGARILRNYEDKDKILIVISDGRPDNTERVKYEVDELRKNGIKVMEVAVSSGVEDYEQEAAYGAGNYIPMKGSDPSVVIVPLTRWLKKQL